LEILSYGFCCQSSSATVKKENVKPCLFTYKLLVDTKGASKRHFEVMEKVVESMQVHGVESDIMLDKTYLQNYLVDTVRKLNQFWS
jgi:hypothetical protein